MKKVLTFMIVSLVSSITHSITAEKVFEKQTYALFERDQISMEVLNTSTELSDTGIVAKGDLVLKVRADRQDILKSLEEKLIKNYVSYQFPDGISESEKEKEIADKILANGIAEFIIRASLGSNIVRGGTIYRPKSKITLLRDKDNGELYLEVFGERVYVENE